MPTTLAAVYCLIEVSRMCLNTHHYSHFVFYLGFSLRADFHEKQLRSVGTGSGSIMVSEGHETHEELVWLVGWRGLKSIKGNLNYIC